MVILKIIVIMEIIVILKAIILTHDQKCSKFQKYPYCLVNLSKWSKNNFLIFSFYQNHYKLQKMARSTFWPSWALCPLPVLGITIHVKSHYGSVLRIWVSLMNQCDYFISCISVTTKPNRNYKALITRKGRGHKIDKISQPFAR